MIISTLCIVSTADAQVFSENPFGSANAAASGGSAQAVQNDVWSFTQNPAGYAGLQALSAAVGNFSPSGQSFSQWTSFAAAGPLSQTWGALAVHGEQSGISYGGRSYGSESSVGLSHGFYLQKDLRSSLRFGYSLNYYTVDYGQSAGLSGDGRDGMDLGSGSVLGINAGLQASLRDRSWLGVTIRNINSPLLGSSGSASNLPRRITASLAYQPYYGLISSLSLDKGMDSEMQYRAGISYDPKPWLTLRSGVVTYPSQLTLGAGLRWAAFQLDYAWISHPVLTPTHMFSLSIQRERD